jgi:hypothetical protein
MRHAVDRVLAEAEEFGHFLQCHQFIHILRPIGSGTILVKPDRCILLPICQEFDAMATGDN